MIGFGFTGRYSTYKLQLQLSYGAKVGGAKVGGAKVGGAEVGGAKVGGEEVGPSWRASVKTVMFCFNFKDAMTIEFHDGDNVVITNVS